MGPSEGNKDFVVEDPDPTVYNLGGADPPVWEPQPDDILAMFQQLETEKVLPLKWVCHGRRPPEKEPAEQELGMPSEEEEDDFDKMEEKRAPEPSAFDFDDTASEASTRIVPRTPVSAKRRPEKKVARMDNVLSSIRRQQQAERQARRSFPRGHGASPFRGGTPRMPNFSPASSPVSTRFAGSPRAGGVGSPRLGTPSKPEGEAPGTPNRVRLGVPASSPSLSQPSGSPSPLHQGQSGSPQATKGQGQAGSPSNIRLSGSPSNARSSGSPSNARSSGSPSSARSSGSPSNARLSGSPSNARGLGNTASPKGAGSPAAAIGTSIAIASSSAPVQTSGPSSGVATATASEPSAAGSGKEGGADTVVKMETDAADTATSVASMEEGKKS